MNIEALISVLLLFAFTLGWKLFDHLQKLHRSHNMFIKIGWIAEKENNMICSRDSIKLRDMELISYIIEEQTKLNISKEFCIDHSNESEKQYAKEILNLHKDNVIKSYFSDFLAKSKDICKLNSLEYYFYSLYCFIYKFDEHNLNQDKIYMNKEFTDKNHFNCQLTDYGRTYYKLYLISLTFIEKNEKTKKCFKYINPNLKNNIIEYLEKNQVSFWSYRH